MEEFFAFEPQVAVAWVTAIGAIVVAFMIRRSQNSTVDVNKLVDTSMRAMEQRIAALEARIALLEVENARLTRIEEELQDDVDERDQIIADLQERVERLELWVRAQGVDPEAVVSGAVD